MTSDVAEAPDRSGRIGAASAEIAKDDGPSYVARCRAESPLRLLTPRGGGDAAWLVASSFGGGLVDGDSIDLDVKVGERAGAVITTQSSTKIYRGTSSQTTRARLADGALLVLVPDPVVPFAGASFRQSTHLSLEPTSSLAMFDALTAGRVARGERWAAARLQTSLSIDIAGRPLLRDVVLLDPAHGPLAARLGRFDATATIVLLGPRLSEVATDTLRRIQETRLTRSAGLILAASPLAGGVFLRVAATTIAQLLEASRSILAPAMSALGEDPWSRKW